MATKNILAAKGLHTFYNSLSSIPDGALLQADNVVIDSVGVIRPRRGFAKFGTTFGGSSDRLKQLIDYKGRILGHYGSSLIFDSDGSGSFSTFNGTFDELVTGLRIKYIEANGNLYFTTDTGIRKISATSASDFTTSSGFVTNAGGVKALDVTGAINYTTAGFFSVSSKVAYRVVWGITDANNNKILGVPSSRLVVTNFDGSLTGTVDLTFNIPTAIGSNTSYFYQIYRSEVVSGTTASDDPGDELNLIIEDFPTSGELSAGVVTVNDVTPEDFRQNGELLYTNPISGEGIAQANDIPPLARDINIYKNTVFYANTETKHRKQLTLLSVDDLTSSTSTITITDGSTTNTYTFVGEAEVTDITFDTQANTTDGGYFLLNSASDERGYVIYADKTGSTAAPSAGDTSGRIIMAVDISGDTTAAEVASSVQAVIDALDDFSCSVVSDTITITNAKNGNTTDAVDGTTGFGGGAFSISVTTQGDGEDAGSLHVLLSSESTVGLQIDETARSLVNIINGNASEIVEAFYLSGSDDIPGNILLEAKTLGTSSFSLTANSTTTGAEFSPELPTSGTSVSSDNEVSPNRMYFSKFQQPEAVPIVNFLDIGPKDKSIRRILPLRESLFILKEDGIYRLTGEAGNFIVDLFDNSSLIIAPDSAAVVNNQIFCLSTQGVVQISDTGVEIVSRPIEDTISKISSSDYDFEFNTFAVGYEIDRSYLLFTVTSTSDTTPTQCFRYNVLTNAWTRWPIEKSCGVVGFTDNKLYLGPTDQNFVERERKNFLRTDYADRSSTNSFANGFINNTTTSRITLSSTSDVEEGDAIVQTQYVTIIQFNLLLNKLDIDASITATDWFSSLGMVDGDNLREKIDDLAAKLDSDPDVNDTDYASSIGSSSDFSDMQTDYNTITSKLNSDTGVDFINYPTSSGTVDQETIITSVRTSDNTVVVIEIVPFMVGTLTLYKGIESKITWAPEHFGDPTLRKQFREGTVIFDTTSFPRGTVGYKSDLSPDFEEVLFDFVGDGNWGTFVDGQATWGGEGLSVPVRTYIPRDKQRSRFLLCRFVHNSARQQYKVFGISYTARPISERAYSD